MSGKKSTLSHHTEKENAYFFFCFLIKRKDKRLGGWVGGGGATPAVHNIERPRLVSDVVHNVEWLFLGYSPRLQDSHTSTCHRGINLDPKEKSKSV